MHHPPQDSSSPDVHLPLKFAGGFGLDSRRIGAIFTFFSISSTLCQFLLFPPLARRLGVLVCLRIAFLIFPFVFFVTPFISLIQDPLSRETAMIVLLMIRGVGGTFAFPTSTIMLTNSATSLRVLGTINGLATSVSAIGRALGPAIGGGLFTWGVKRGYVIVPFWTMCVISIGAAIPTFWLVEGKGFGDDDDTESDTESEVDEERRLLCEPRSSRIAAGVGVGIGEGDRIGDDLETVHSESEFGDIREPPNLLSYTSTHSSVAAVSISEDLFSSDDDGPSDARRRSGTTGQVNGANDRARSQSQGRRYTRVRRRSSVPIGMGKGFRRLSSNLGSTGIGAGGASWGGT